MLKIGNRGFTLFEATLAAAVLSLLALLIYEAFFISLDTFNYCANYLDAALWMDEKIWQTQDDLSRFGIQAQVETNGKFTHRNKDFEWHLSHNLIDENLYKIGLRLCWQEGHRRIELTRAAYAVHEEEE